MPEDVKTIEDLFPDAPEYSVPLPQDELRLLSSLPDHHPHETVQEVEQDDEAACRRLEKRGLVKVHRWKDDPIAVRPTMYAGRLS